MKDIDHSWPAILQLRKLKNFKQWACTKYDTDIPSMPLIYTKRFGQSYPWLKSLQYVEAATHSSIWQLYLFWLPVFCFMFTTQVRHINPWLFSSGIVSWTLAEYCLHRFIFHNSFCNTYLPEITFLLHYNHHKQPHDLSRLSTPLLLSLPIAWLMLQIMGTWMCWHDTMSWGLGICLGYMGYDFVHYMTHARPLVLSIQQHHMGHHQLCEKKFGFTSRVWDKVFGTE